MPRKSYEQALKLKPDYVEAINNLGTVYYAKKSYRRAISLVQQGAENRARRPKSASIHMNLGTAYFARKQIRGRNRGIPDGIEARSRGVRTARQFRGDAGRAQRGGEEPSTTSTWPSSTPKTAATSWLYSTCGRAWKRASKSARSWRPIRISPRCAILPEFKLLLTSEPRVL